MADFRIETGMHHEAVQHVSCDAAGRLILTASRTEVRAFDPAGNPLGPRLDIGNSATAALSPDGKTVALRWGNDAPRSLCLVEQATGRLLRWMAPDLAFYHVAFSRDGRRLLLVGESVQVRDVDSGRLLLEHESEGGQRDADMDDVGRLVLIQQDGLRLVLLDAHGHKIASIYRADEEGRYRRVRFSPDSRVIAATCEDPPRILLLSGRDLSSRGAADTSGIDQHPFTSLAWSQDGQTLYAGGPGAVHAFDQAGRGARRSAMVEGAVGALAPLPQGGVAFASDAPAWGVLDPDLTPRHAARWERARFSEDPGHLLVSEDGRRVAFRLASGETRCFSSLPGEGLLREAPAGAELRPPRKEAPWLRLFPAKGKLRIRHEDQEDNEFTADYHHVAVSADGAACLLSDGGILRYVDAYALDRVWYDGDGGRCVALNLSGDGLIAVSAHEDGTLRFRAARDGALLLTVLLHGDGQRWVAFRPDGRYIASPGGADLIGWDVSRDEPLVSDHREVKSRRERAAEIGAPRQGPSFGRPDFEAKNRQDAHIAAHRMIHVAVEQLAGWRDGLGACLAPDFTPASLLVERLRQPAAIAAAIAAPAPRRPWPRERARLWEQSPDLRVSQDGAQVSFRLASGALRCFDLHTGTLGEPADTAPLLAPRTTAKWLRVEPEEGRLYVRRLDDPDREDDEPFERFALTQDGGGCVIGRGDRLSCRDTCSISRDIWSRSDLPPIVALCFSGDGQLVVSAHADGTICWRAARDGELRLTLIIHQDEQRCVAMTEDGAYAGTLGRDGGYDVAKVRAALRAPLAERTLWARDRARLAEDPAALRVSHDGRTLALRLEGGEERFVQITAACQVSGTPPDSVPLLPAQTSAPWLEVFEEEKRLRITDTEDRDKEEERHFDQVAVSPDGGGCVVSKETEIRYIRAAGLRNPCREDNAAPNLAVQFSGDGRLIVSACADGTVRWRSAGGGCYGEGWLLLTLVLHRDGQRCVLYTKDGDYVSSPEGPGAHRPEQVQAALRNERPPPDVSSSEGLYLPPLLPPRVRLIDTKRDGQSLTVRVAARSQAPIIRLRLAAADGTGVTVEGAALDETFVPCAEGEEQQHEIRADLAALGAGALMIWAETEHAIGLSQQIPHID